MPVHWDMPGSVKRTTPTCLDVVVVLPDLELLVVEKSDRLEVEQRIHRLAGGQVVKLDHLLAHLGGFLQQQAGRQAGKVI